jgi:hypothetical protein
MTRQEAEKILPLVNNKQAMDALEVYLTLRVEDLKESLVYKSPEEEAYRGAIQELRRFKHLRDEVLNAKD